MAVTFKGTKMLIVPPRCDLCNDSKKELFHHQDAEIAHQNGIERDTWFCRDCLEDVERRRV